MTYYLVKAYSIKDVGISKVHVVDDNCIEYMATATNGQTICGYYSENELGLCCKKPYDKNVWQMGPWAICNV